jgi:hypothetical protein
MKTSLLAVSAALALVALAPAAQADAGPAAANPCESGFGAYAVFGDVCLDTRSPSCTAWIEWHAIPSMPTCLLAPPAAEASSSGVSPQCMDVYHRDDVLHYSIVRRDSCSAEVYECPYPGAPISQCRHLLTSMVTSSAAAPAGPQCMQVYQRTDVGTYSIVRRNSCAPPEVYECPYPKAPIPECEPLLRADAAASADSSMAACYYVYQRYDAGPLTVVRTSSCAVPEFYKCPYEGAPIEDCSPLLELSATASAQEEPMCMYYYFEYRVGPVRHVQRDSCHSETYVCDERVREFVATAPEQDPAALVECARDSVDSLGVLA